MRERDRMKVQFSSVSIFRETKHVIASLLYLFLSRYLPLSLCYPISFSELTFSLNRNLYISISLTSSKKNPKKIMTTQLEGALKRLLFLQLPLTFFYLSFAQFLSSLSFTLFLSFPLTLFHSLFLSLSISKSPFSFLPEDLN